MEDTIQKKEILEIIKNITNANRVNKFPAFIKTLRFPFYKNIAKDAEINKFLIFSTPWDPINRRMSEKPKATH